MVSRQKSVAAAITFAGGVAGFKFCIIDRLPSLVASCTYEMRRFCALGLWLQRIRNSSPYFLEFVFLLLVIARE
jgi:hypothetical protein